MLLFEKGNNLMTFCSYANSLSPPSRFLPSLLPPPPPLPLPVGLWRGLGPRILMVGTLTSLQFFIFDAVKVVLRLPRPPPPEMPASLRAKWEGKHT